MASTQVKEGGKTNSPMKNLKTSLLKTDSVPPQVVSSGPETQTTKSSKVLLGSTTSSAKKEMTKYTALKELTLSSEVMVSINSSVEVATMSS